MNKIMNEIMKRINASLFFLVIVSIIIIALEYKGITALGYKCNFLVIGLTHSVIIVYLVIYSRTKGDKFLLGWACVVVPSVFGIVDCLMSIDFHTLSSYVIPTWPSSSIGGISR